ncbi:hypothetical protein ASZ90_004006 [hydrocarbon metagenome]|uniref:DUF1905 domain-containing protein n=1 Tax=hydrocarbon metagenome TaxID=938273 RepID=A0A0W8FZ63_9ZZZZ
MKNYKFTSVLHKTTRGGYGVEFPYDVKKEFGTGGMVKVKAKIGGVDYRGSLTPMGGQNHMLIVLKEIREKLGLTNCDKINIELSQDTEPRVVIIPDDLKRLFQKNKTAKDIFDGMSYTHHKDMLIGLTMQKKMKPAKEDYLKL